MNAKTGGPIDGFAGIRIIMGFNLVIEAENGDLLNVDAAGLNRFTCVKSRMEDYASELKTNRVGDGNAENFDEFIKGKDRYGNPVKVKKILAQSCYVVYLNPADDAEQNEIVFKMRRTAA